MSIYVAKLSSCECCAPVPDFIFRADNIVSAVMKAHEALEGMNQRAEKANLDHDEPEITAIEEMFGVEIMDEQGLAEVVEVWEAMKK